MRKLNDKIRTEKDTLYIFSNDFFAEANEITEKENELAQKFLSMIGTSKDDQEEIMLVLQPQQLYHFLVRVQLQQKHRVPMEITFKNMYQ